MTVPRRRSPLAGVIAALVCGLGPAPAGANPLRLVSRTRLNARLEQLAFRTPAVRGITGVRVLLPAGYAAHLRRRYPVLYLLHGALSDDTSWTEQGEAEQITARYPLIVVMPDSGPTGGYTDWFNGGRGGQPEWERYHIDELLPWIDAHLRTRASRAERAIAGLSMGGFGAISYAARHPDLFAAAASFSGAVDTNNPLDVAVTPDAVWGPRATDQVIWRGHDPWDLAGNLRGLSLTIRTGNGQPGGPFGPEAPDIVELAVHEMSVSLHARLAAMHIPSIWDDYGPGGHDWPYWQRDLRQTLPTLMRLFGHPRPAPQTLSYTAIEPVYAVSGWSVALARRALEFSTLRARGARGFSLTGSGTASVTTPRLYRAGYVVRVIIRDAHGRHVRRLIVGRSGRVTAPVSLGPSNRFQQYTAAAQRVAHRSVTAVVTLTPAG